MREPNRKHVKAALVAWSIVWGATWLYLTVTALTHRGQPQPPALLWFRTGALVAAWMGIFALRTVDRD